MGTYLHSGNSRRLRSAGAMQSNLYVWGHFIPLWILKGPLWKVRHREISSVWKESLVFHSLNKKKKLKSALNYQVCGNSFGQEWFRAESGAERTTAESFSRQGVITKPRYKHFITLCHFFSSVCLTHSLSLSHLLQHMLSVHFQNTPRTRKESAQLNLSVFFLHLLPRWS